MQLAKAFMCHVSVVCTRACMCASGVAKGGLGGHVPVQLRVE